jgi:hypothetical protein
MAATVVAADSTAVAVVEAFTAAVGAAVFTVVAVVDSVTAVAEVIGEEIRGLSAEEALTRAEAIVAAQCLVADPFLVDQCRATAERVSERVAEQAEVSPADRVA